MATSSDEDSAKLIRASSSSSSDSGEAVCHILSRRNVLFLIGACLLVVCAGVLTVAFLDMPSAAPPPPPNGVVEEKSFNFPQDWPEQAPLQCRKLLDRLETMQKVAPKPWYDRDDKDFPPRMTSIGEVDICGDFAQGVYRNCSDYNHWVPLLEVARKFGFRNVSVFKSGGVQGQDIGQGELGTCYFLGALASLANSSPRTIESMFVRRDLWASGIYVTKWLINDKELLIAVDDMIPASRDNVPYFVKPSPTGEFWPAILEKAWAKIHSTFQSIENGFWPMVVMAVTRAPVRTRYHNNGLRPLIKDFLSHYYQPSLYHQTDVHELWPLMLNATKNGQPMGASTDEASGRYMVYGLAPNHQYSVFRAREYDHPDGTGRVRDVDVFNPWNSADSKRGALFTMKYHEYWDAFYATDFADVRPDYFPTAKKILHGQENKWSHHNFQISNVSEGQPFFVSLTWPSPRLMKPCDMLQPEVIFEVVRTDENHRHTSEIHRGKRDGHDVNSLTAEIREGPGSYHVMTHVKFDAQNYIDDIFISVYAPEQVHITEVSGIAAGDRFNLTHWGTCVAQYHNGELRMQSEADPAMFWVTARGGVANLTNQSMLGAPATAYWEGPLGNPPLPYRGKVSLLMDDQHIFISQGMELAGGMYMTRVNATPLPGSSDWWTCQHDHMFKCGKRCCCDDGVQWSEVEQACKPV